MKGSELYSWWMSSNAEADRDRSSAVPGREEETEDDPVEHGHGEREMRALEAMERSAGWVRTLVAAVERAQDVILITEAEPFDEPGPRIVYVNDMFQKMTGYSRDEVIGKTPRILQGPESDREAIARISAGLRSWRPVREELINYRKDGTKFWVELSIFPIADENGWYTHWVAIQRETTEQNAVRAQLQQSEERLRTLTESIPQLLWTATADGLCEFVSQTCAEFLGASMERCTGYGWAEFIHPDDREQTFARWKDSIARGTTFITEYRLRRHDGMYLWFLHRATPRRSVDGRVVEWIGTSTDIVVQKRSEELLRQTEKLAAVGRLASTISHEINNPLEGMTNLLYLMESNPSLDAEAREYLQMAQHQLARVSEITTQSLRFHRQATGASERLLSEKLDALLNLHRPRLEANGIVVRRRYLGDSTLSCFGSEMRQAMGNVMLNAIDALPPRGLLWVRARPAREWGGKGRRGVRVTIADTGAGIAPDDLPRIFDAFFTTKGVSGTGLGLWITRGIVERHEGRMWVRSSTRRGRSGTVFVMFFPYERVDGVG